MVKLADGEGFGISDLRAWWTLEAAESGLDGHFVADLERHLGFGRGADFEDCAGEFVADADGHCFALGGREGLVGGHERGLLGTRNGMGGRSSFYG